MRRVHEGGFGRLFWQGENPGEDCQEGRAAQGWPGVLQVPELRLVAHGPHRLEAAEE